MWTNYCIRTIEIVTINLCFFWCESTLIRNVITIVETIASSHKNNSVWFSKIITLNSFWTRTKKPLLLQVVRKSKMFLFWTIGTLSLFQMQINFNVYVLTKLETITSNSISFLILTIINCWGIQNNTLTITKTSRVWRSADNAEPLALRGSLKSLEAHV